MMIGRFKRDQGSTMASSFLRVGPGVGWVVNCSIKYVPMSFR